jgi:hypothetical protein
MAVANDASTPARWSNTWHATNGGSIVSDSFTAPADALLVACCNYDSNSSGTPGATSFSDSGGLTWTKQVERLWNETLNGGGSVIFTARTTSSVARTATLTGAAGATGGWGTGRASAKLYVFTGVDVDGTPVDTVGANNEGTTFTNDMTTSSLTPGATGLLVAVDTEWNQLGAITSSDLTIDAATYASAIDVASGYKVCTSGIGVTGNLNAGGTSSAVHKWCQIIVREAAGGGGGATPPVVPAGDAAGILGVWESLGVF